MYIMPAVTHCDMPYYDSKHGESTHPPVASTYIMQGFVSSSERFSAAAAPIAAPDYASFDGSTMKGDQARLGPGAYIKLVRMLSPCVEMGMVFADTRLTLCCVMRIC
jgi:hypothetical protein